jgi:hypothetical protein
MQTNNGVEGRHRRAKQEAHQHGDLNLYLLIELLHVEATHANHQLRLMSDGRLRRYCHGDTTSLNGRLNTLWTVYCAGELSISKSLKRAARLQLLNWLQ